MEKADEEEEEEEEEKKEKIPIFVKAYAIDPFEAAALLPLQVLSQPT